LAKEGIAILENRVVRERIKADLSRVNKKLGKGGAAIKTASIAAKMMGLVWVLLARDYQQKCIKNQIIIN